MPSLPSVGARSTAQRALRPLVAGLAVGSASSLSATIIYSGTPIVYEGTPSYAGDGSVSQDSFQNFSVGATDNFKLYAGPDQKDSPTFKVSLGATSESGGGVTTEAARYDVINANNTFRGENNVIQMDPGQHYYGLSINDGAMYGWVSMLNSGDGVGSVQEWAYENSGESIVVGAIPEPATTVTVTAAAAALLAGSAAIWNRRRQKQARVAA